MPRSGRGITFPRSRALRGRDLHTGDGGEGVEPPFLAMQPGGDRRRATVPRGPRASTRTARGRFGMPGLASFTHVSRISQLVRAAFPWCQVHTLMESVSSMDEVDRGYHER